MTKMTTIDRNSLKAMRAPIEAALAELGAQLGVKFTAGSGAYGGATGHFKLKIEIDNEEIQDAAKRARFENECRLFGFEPQDYRANFEIGGKTLQLVGFNNSLKMPIEAVDSDGKPYKVSAKVHDLIVAARKVTEPA